MKAIINFSVAVYSLFLQNYMSIFSKKERFFLILNGKMKLSGLYNRDVNRKQNYL